ncbi:hypothetical protein JAAARDRAFT_649876 [Jaapia argillacea MUCL 33604]|uniref:Uncharacterized protein n=1 Tax=Jaapia argillacea MUCL 33604 TaxID=933084 RepID=A0A067PYP1_9AGAM|nr:hypothetical protein JAAARDRAFT_649876 [Jaapia argillacea MUCL 33604]
MPAKYSHVKKRSASGPQKKSSAMNGGGNNANSGGGGHHHHHSKDHRNPDPHLDRSISQAMTAVSQLERAIARILLIRYEQDIARLFSTHLYSVALVHLPTFVMRCLSVGGPGWVAANSDCDDIKDFFRACIGMDLRQAGERVATKSVLWSYTALRHFAMSNNVSICRKRGLHSLRLLPYFPALKAHLDMLEAMPAASFARPPHLGPLTEGIEALEDACELKFGALSPSSLAASLTGSSPTNGQWDTNEWRTKVKLGYERICQTLWRVAREFDVRGYGMVLREKLTTKWCNCGCSTDHLGEVCEKTVREDEEESGVRPGKQREWDGRGAGVFGWETEEEEDVWDLDLDFSALEPEECDDGIDPEMTIGELMEWRYLRAEKAKELGNSAFRQGEYELAIQFYKTAHEIEPEMPHYQLNIAAAYLKIQKWMEAENACNAALNQHKSGKGFFRRAKARTMQGKTDEAVKDYRAALKIQPNNTEALAELISLLPPDPTPQKASSSSFSSSSMPSSSSSSFAPSSSSSSSFHPTHSASSSFSGNGSSNSLDYLRIPKSKPLKPLPFARTEADDRKLKISLTPMTIDMPVDSFFVPRNPGRVASNSNANGATANGGSNGKGHVNAGLGMGKGKAQGSGWMRRKGGKMVSETIVYPSWERYVVKRTG